MNVLFWRHKKPCYSDFAEVLNNFERDLGILATHIRDHNHIVGAERTAADVEVLAAKIRYFNDFEGPPSPPWDDSTEEEKVEWAKDYREQEEAAWDDIWDHARKQMRRWWD